MFHVKQFQQTQFYLLSTKTLLSNNNLEFNQRQTKTKKHAAKRVLRVKNWTDIEKLSACFTWNNTFYPNKSQPNNKPNRTLQYIKTQQTVPKKQTKTCNISQINHNFRNKTSKTAYEKWKLHTKKSTRRP